MVRWVFFAMLAVGCGDEEPEETGPVSNGAGDCTDAAVNPYINTCSADFVADCFNPVGECDGIVEATGAMEFEWANGAMVTTEMNGLTPTTRLISGDGTVCAEGITEISFGSDCIATTTYTHMNGDVISYCSSIQGDMTVTCPDLSTFTVTAAEASSGQACQYGGNEPCDVQVNAPGAGG